MYKNSVLKKILVSGILISFFIAISPISGSDILVSNNSSSNIMLYETNDCPINITVHEAWELLNDTSNGIQIPIDVRTEEEWNESFIDTPWPEHPRWIGDIIIEEFEGGEVIFYCKGGYRSLLFCYLLCESGFNGTIYNMIGGITAWIEEGYPVRNNTPPEAPEIKEDNPRSKQITGFIKNFKIKTNDPDGDKIYLYIDWDDGSFEEWIGPYNSGEDVAINHTYEYEGTFKVQAKAIDIFYDEGPWGTLQVTIPESRATFYSFFKLFINRIQILRNLLELHLY